MAQEVQPGRRQYVKFTFFKTEKDWRRLPVEDREAQKAELVGVVERWAERNLVRCYSTMGTRGDVDFMVWQVSYELDDIQAMASELMGTTMAGWLATPFSYLSMTKHSVYVEKYSGPGQDKFTRLTIAPGAHRYLFVYPLTKVREWYGLSAEERQQAMNEHIATGRTYPSIKLNTTYSFGLDDQEFVLSFEGDDPGEFLDLVQELRPSVSSAYTLTDVPIFVCKSVSAREMLEMLTGAALTVPA
jgi:chlorite dismutase